VLLQEAAKGGQPAAMFHLGELYRHGTGVAQNSSEAETWLRRAATRGYLKAWLSLVQLFRSGPDADLHARPCCAARPRIWAMAKRSICSDSLPDRRRRAADPRSARWLARAADQNVTAAYNRLGSLYAEA